MGDLFEGLPPPSANPQPQGDDIFAVDSSNRRKREPSPRPTKAASPPPPPAPALKSALKRPKPEDSTAHGTYLFTSQTLDCSIDMIAAIAFGFGSLVEFQLLRLMCLS